MIMYVTPYVTHLHAQAAEHEAAVYALEAASQQWLEQSAREVISKLNHSV